jgi:formylglycine-generating enzyme required for sulfatase activity
MFSPANKSFSNLSVNGTQDFTSQAQVSPTVYVKMVSIPGGTFQMGDVEGVGDTKSQPVHTVTVSEFQMSEAEITNAQYCEWLNGALGRNEVTVSGTSVKGTKGTWSGNEYLNLIYSSGSLNSCWIRYENNMFSVVEGKEKLPVVYVTWYGAKAFCMGNGWDLPREAEWEYACRGGKQYKYGTDDGTISSSKANYNANIGSPKDVGSYPKNPFGLYDMSGNLCEWCADWYGSYASGSQIDPTGPQAGSERVFRGGSWPYFDFSISSAYRYSDYPSVRSYDIGFRPVRRVSF